MKNLFTQQQHCNPKNEGVPSASFRASKHATKRATFGRKLFVRILLVPGILILCSGAAFLPLMSINGTDGFGTLASTSNMNTIGNVNGNMYSNINASMNSNMNPSINTNGMLAMADEGYSPPVAIVELFTSQGCYSCPAADEVLSNDIAVRPQIMALELHVDYWDNLVYGGSSWKDPFSKNAYTIRQRDYNRKLRETNSIFTPQAVVGGHSQASGTHKDLILLAAEQSLQNKPKAHFRFSGGGDTPLQVNVDGTLSPNVLLTYAMYWKTRETNVLRGENKNKILHNINVVYELAQLPFGKRQAILPKYDPETQSCAVWLQRGNAGQIISASKCPFDVKFDT